MITAEAVLEINDHARFKLWSTTRHQGWGYLHLHGEMSEPEVGSAVQAFLGRSYEEPIDGTESFEGYMITTLEHQDPDGEERYAYGGIRFTDLATNVTVHPGCCSTLDERTNIDRFLAGDTDWGWHGHDPTPGAERRGDVIRLLADTDDPACPFIDVSEGELRRAMTDVHVALCAFFDRVSQWATRNTPTFAERLLATFGEALALDQPGADP